MYHGVALDENKTAKHLDDDVISFFIHCYHIRDWIIHLNKLGIISKDVDDFINQHDALKICADFANGAKHCKLIRNTRTDGKPHIAYKKQNSSIWYSDNGGTEITKVEFKIMSKIAIVDALSLAEECMSLWETYIEELKTKIA